MLCKFAGVLLALLLVGCVSSPSIPVNCTQTLLMESSVLAAGIHTNAPSLIHQKSTTVARAMLFNEQSMPVTLYYRYYWYDAKGLEIHPLEEAKSVVIPANSSLQVQSAVAFPLARKVRLSLSLRSL